MATSPMKYLHNIDSFMTPNTGMTYITQFSQDDINGMSGTSDPNMKTIDSDDKLEVGYRRFTYSMNPSNKILWKKPKRKWRRRREERKNKKTIISNKNGDILYLEKTKII